MIDRDPYKMHEEEMRLMRQVLADTSGEAARDRGAQHAALQLGMRVAPALLAARAAALDDLIAKYGPVIAELDDDTAGGLATDDDADNG